MNLSKLHATLILFSSDSLSVCGEFNQGFQADQPLVDTAHIPIYALNLPAS
jgi:hypothetical protein